MKPKWLGKILTKSACNSVFVPVEEHEVLTNIVNGKIENSYHPNGNPRIAYNTVDNKIFFSGYYRTGKLCITGEYEHGTLVGKKTDYYENGNTKCIAFLENGRVCGEYIEYHANGSLRYIGTFDNNVKTGRYTHYYDTGMIQCLGIAENGKDVGEFKLFTMDGKLIVHKFILNDDDITNEIKELVVDIKNLSIDDKIMIKLKYGVPCL